jgi:hypothetical protein
LVCVLVGVEFAIMLAVHSDINGRTTIAAIGTGRFIRDQATLPSAPSRPLLTDALVPLLHAIVVDSSASTRTVQDDPFMPSWTTECVPLSQWMRLEPSSCSVTSQSGAELVEVPPLGSSLDPQPHARTMMIRRSTAIEPRLGSAGLNCSVIDGAVN